MVNQTNIPQTIVQVNIKTIHIDIMLYEQHFVENIFKICLTFYTICSKIITVKEVDNLIINLWFAT